MANLANEISKKTQFESSELKLLTGQLINKCLLDCLLIMLDDWLNLFIHSGHSLIKITDNVVALYVGSNHLTIIQKSIKFMRL